jgi:hypothetical protein
MGFNARLTPYTVTKEVNFHTNTDTDTFDVDHFVFRFPFAGQLVGAYACLGQGAAALAGDDKTTNLYEVSLWKEGEATDAGVYATGARAAKRTGELANTTGALIWALNRVYALTNLTAARRKFAAGDKMYLRTGYTAATSHNTTTFAFQQEKIEIQADYIIGYEA